MNNQIERLQQIRAKCVELLALAENRTPGKWEPYIYGSIIEPQSTYTVAKADPEETRKGNSEDTKADAAFIAACAGPSEASWRATIAAIDGLLISDPDRFSGDGQILIALQDSILAAWEGVA